MKVELFLLHLNFHSTFNSFLLFEFTENTLESAEINIIISSSSGGGGGNAKVLVSIVFSLSGRKRRRQLRQLRYVLCKKKYSVNEPADIVFQPFFTVV